MPHKDPEARKAYIAANRDKVRAYSQKYNLAHKAEGAAWYRANKHKLDKVKIAERKKAWDEANIERRRLYRAAHALANPGKQKEWLRLWRLAHVEEVRAHNFVMSQKRRAWKAGSRIGPVSYKAIRERDKGVCGICHEPIPLTEQVHYDHIIPLSKGGAHVTDNLQMAHARCNLRKGSKLFL